MIEKNCFVLPERALNEGFNFKFKTIENALTNI
jgi:NAD dependent epimerase/dehydratase family enzyme